MIKTGIKMTEKPVMVEHVEAPHRNFIYNKSLEDFSQHGSVSDNPKKIYSSEKETRYVKKSP